MKGWSKGLTVATDERVAKRYGEKHSFAVSQAKKGQKYSEEARRRMSEAHKGRIVSLETRKKISESRLGEKHWAWGRSQSEESNKKRSLALKGRKKPLRSEEWKKKRRKISKALWQQPEFVKKQMKSRHTFPNKWEIQVDSLLQRILPDEYKYVGDGQFILGGKCPDFLNINGKKLLIEFYGDYWHRNDDPEIRIGFFKKYGFNTLVIWGHELKDIPLLSSKILDFNKTNSELMR